MCRFHTGSDQKAIETETFAAVDKAVQQSVWHLWKFAIVWKKPEQPESVVAEKCVVVAAASEALVCCFAFAYVQNHCRSVIAYSAGCHKLVAVNIHAKLKMNPITNYTF